MNKIGAHLLFCVRTVNNIASFQCLRVVGFKVLKKLNGSFDS